MKKKILSIILLLVLVMSTTACVASGKLNKIAKNINNSESVKTYIDAGYKMKASAFGNRLVLKSKIDKTKSKVEFKLKKNILSNENLSTNDLIFAMLVINGVGQTYGYEDGELSQNINSFPEEYEKYTLEKEGFELVTKDDRVSLKIDVSKKVPLIDMDLFYLKPSDFDMISRLVEDEDSGNESGKKGNIAYDIFVGEDESTIQIGQDEKLSDSAYRSIVSALEVMYGIKTASHFKDVYPKFLDKKTTVGEFTIETNYKPEDQADSIFKDTKVVLVTINNSKLKK